MISLFVQLSRIIGLPRSYAELYALLFLSPRPLTMDEMIQRRGISKGSASQGLRFSPRPMAKRIAFPRAPAKSRSSRRKPCARVRRLSKVSRQRSPLIHCLFAKESVLAKLVAELESV